MMMEESSAQNVHEYVLEQSSHVPIRVSSIYVRPEENTRAVPSPLVSNELHVQREQSVPYPGVDSRPGTRGGWFGPRKSLAPFRALHLFADAPRSQPRRGVLTDTTSCIPRTTRHSFDPNRKRTVLPLIEETCGVKKKRLLDRKFTSHVLHRTRTRRSCFRAQTSSAKVSLRRSKKVYPTRKVTTEAGTMTRSQGQCPIEPVNSDC